MLVIKNLPANAEDMRGGFDTWVGKIPWRRAWQPTPVLLPGESQKQKSLAGPNIVAWRIPQTEESGRLRFIGSQRVVLKQLSTHALLNNF